MKPRYNIDKNIGHNDIQLRGRPPNNHIYIKDQILDNLDREREDDCTVFSMRENTIRNMSTIYQERLPREHVKPKKKRKQKKVSNNSALEINRSDYQHSKNSGTTVTYTKGNSSFSVNHSINIQDMTSKNSKVIQQMREGGFARSRNIGYSQETRDGVGDEEPLFPMIIQNRRKMNRQNHNNSDGMIDQEVSFEQNVYQGPKSRAKSNLSYGRYNDIGLKKKGIESQEYLADLEVNKFGGYLGQAAKQLALYLHNNSDIDLNETFSGPITQNHSRRIINNSTRAHSSQKNKEEFFPRLNIKELDPETYRTNLAYNQASVPHKKPYIKPTYTTYTSKQLRNPVSLDITAPLSRVSSARRERVVVENKSQRSQYLIEDTGKSENKITHKPSNLLKPVPKEQNSSVKADLTATKKQDSSFSNDTTPLLKSNRSQSSSSRLTLNNTVKTPLLKFETPRLDSNRLVRGQYRVQNHSARSLSARSDRELGPKGDSRSMSPSLQKELTERGTLTNCLEESNKENADQPKPLYELKLNLNEKVKSADSHNKNSSMASIPNTPSQIQQQRDKASSNISFLQDGHLSSLTKRNKSTIDKFNKEWEEHKRKIEKGVLKEASFIQFQTIGNPLIPRSKCIAFERSGRRALFPGSANIPGPGKYKVKAPTRNNAYSFRGGKKFDITGLPLLEDVNKMMDTLRHVKQAV